MPTMTSYHHEVMTLLLLIIALLADYLALACDIEAAKSSTPGTPGGWSDAAVDDNSVVELKETVAKDAIVTKAHHVIESYQQVVAGVNYCIRFSASTSCSSYHCQAVECVAGGHRPLPVGDRKQPVQRHSVSCTQTSICDLERAREIAKTPMSGQWQAENNSSELVSQLYTNAAAIADVRLGLVQEAYVQVVSVGFNYCIQFDSTGSANCHSRCRALRCVAKGHLPLNHNTNNPGVVSRIGVTCQPGGKLLGYAGNSADISASLAVTSLMTSLVLFIIVTTL